jgi:hypothetical protein
LVLSARRGSYANTNYYFDDVSEGFRSSDTDYTNILVSAGVPYDAITFVDDALTTSHITNATNVAAYFCFGGHSPNLGPYFCVNGAVKFYGRSDWYVMTTYESYNGRLADPGLSCFGRWFASNAFGGTDYSNVPVGAMGNADEEGVPGIKSFFALWVQGKNLAISVWNAMGSAHYAVAIGDPLITQ